MKHAYFVLALLLLTSCVTVFERNTETRGPMGPESMGDHMGMMISSEEEFVVEMIPHHQEAVDTSIIIAENTDNEELRDLANRIISAQRSEIEMMEGWLDTYYDGGHEPSYEEMMPDLERLEGDDQDVAYIEGMIMHHMMAVRMARQVLALNPSEHVADFANDVVRVQTSEIREMQRMLQDY